MSILQLSPADFTPQSILPLLIPLTALAALAILIILGVFRPRKILGPPRLSPGESPRILIATLGFALAVWAFSMLALDVCHGWRLKVHGQPPTTPLSNAETVLYGAGTDIAVLIAILASTANRTQGPRRMGVTFSRFPGGLLRGLFAIILVFPLILIVDAVTQSALTWLHKSPPPHDLLEILKTHPAPWLRAADVFSACVIAPIAEEMFFRGLLQTALRYLLNRPWIAVLLTAAAFAVVHRWWTWPQIFFLGICLGYAYERTGNLWISITMHALFNVTSMWLFVHYG
jgi:membrane protease YdiL (CAAX protease family)